MKFSSRSLRSVAFALSILLASPFSVLGATPPVPQDTVPDFLLNSKIEFRIHAVKKVRQATLVELSFTNPTNQFLPFTASEIYLDSEDTYSIPPLSPEKYRDIMESGLSASAFPGFIALGLGLGALGSAIGGKGNASRGLAIGALAAGGVYVLTRSLENESRDGKLIGIENNSVTTIKRLPPQITLGGILMFPASKKPKSISIVTHDTRGHPQKITIPLPEKSSSPRSPKSSESSPHRLHSKD